MDVSLILVKDLRVWGSHIKLQWSSNIFYKETKGERENERIIDAGRKTDLSRQEKYARMLAASFRMRDVTMDA